jgi:hypothetical protein
LLSDTVQEDLTAKKLETFLIIYEVNGVFYIEAIFEVGRHDLF